MKLKRKFLTTLLLILLVISLLITVALCFCNSFLNKTNIVKLEESINIVQIIKEEKSIADWMEEKKVPIDIFDYINEAELNNLINLAIDNLYNKNKTIIESTDLEKIIINSVNIYEDKYNVDIYIHIKEEIKQTSIDIVEKLNNEELVNTFNTIYGISQNNIKYIAILLTVIIAITILILEKETFLFIGGLISITFSLVIVYIKNRLANDFIIEALTEHIKNPLLQNINDIIKPIYLFLFVLGTIMLAIYLIFFIKKMIVKYRISFYDKYYGR